MRREYFALPSNLTLNPGLPLHAQGIQEKNSSTTIREGITPACAGNTMRIYMVSSYALGLPLHAQGILQGKHTGPGTVGITPACAGNTGFIFLVFLAEWDYPCMRREYKSKLSTLFISLGLPLHAQGILMQCFYL